MLLLCLCCFFFFKQKTAYEMRISDWSSDVCSSDLFPAATGTRVERRRRRLARRAQLHLDTATARRRRVARQPVEVAQDDAVARQRRLGTDHDTARLRLQAHDEQRLAFAADAKAAALADGVVDDEIGRAHV